MSELIDTATLAEALARFRARAPRVHCITNAVAQTFTANVLLAAGGIPSMTIDAREVGEFISSADALLVNLGTMGPDREEGIAAALDAADDRDIPWALDPVFAERSKPRLALARTLAERGPDILRANGAELEVLAGDESVQSFARSLGTVIACTGAADLLTDGARDITLANGSPMMGAVTAMGCAATALIAGFAGTSPDGLAAAAGALAFVGIAGEEAASKARGPGSFAVGFLDALHSLQPVDIERRTRFS